MSSENGREQVRMSMYSNKMLIHWGSEYYASWYLNGKNVSELSDIVSYPPKYWSSIQSFKSLHVFSLVSIRLFLSHFVRFRTVE